MSAEIEAFYKKIVETPGVLGMIVMNLEGIAIKSTMDPTETTKYVGTIGPLVMKARKMIQEMVVDEEINTEDELSLIRIHTKTHNIIVAPEAEYAMIVIQLPPPQDITYGIPKVGPKEENPTHVED